MSLRFASLLFPLLVFTLAPSIGLAQSAPLDDFESAPRNWAYVAGEEFPGAKGSLSLDADQAHGGKQSYRLNGDFLQGGKYVGAWRNLADFTDGQVSEIRGWVKAQGITKMSARINDATGQCHQKTGIEVTPEWKEFVLRIEDIVGGEHWGGANDGRWHGAATGFGLNVGIDNVQPGKSGSLWLDDLRVVYTPAARATLQACTLSQPAGRPAFGLTVTYHWDAVPLPRNYKVFVHARNAKGQTAFQADHDLPQPTMAWSGPVTYEEALILPSDLAPGTYTLVCGLWDPEGKSRASLNPGAGVTESEPMGYRVGSFTVSPDAPIPKLPAPSLDLTGLHVTFDEDFLGPLDVSAHGPGTRWTAQTPFGLPFGDAKFADPRPGFPFTIAEGILRIEARKVDGHWQSGLLASVDSKGNGFSQKYGYFEMRAKLPKGPGVWPAFWLMGVRGLFDKSVTNIELDILEQYGAIPNALCTTVHFWGPDKLHRSEGKSFIVPGMTDDFHRYGILVDEHSMSFFFDGVELRRMITPPEAKFPVYPLLNLALGSGWPIDKTPNPSILEVDYVRVWAK